MKIAHISDIHIRLYERQEEYKHVFKNLFKDLKKKNPDCIVLTGDIFHNKVNMSPESISLGQSLFENLLKISDVVVIAGNHDANLKSPNRQDAISPIISKIKNSDHDIYYLRNTQKFEYKNVNFFVRSRLDEEETIYPDGEKDTNILLYHGQVKGSQNNTGFVFESSEDVIDFSKFDVVMLGDIHKFQYLGDNIAYSSSLICQDFGEHPFEHGYIMWNIDGKEITSEFHQIYNDYTHVNLKCIEGNIDDSEFEDYLTTTKNANVRIIYDIESYENKEKYEKNIAKKYKLNRTIKSVPLKNVNGDEIFKIKTDIVNLSKRSNQKDAIKKYFFDDSDVDEILKFHEKVYDAAQSKFSDIGLRNEFYVSELEFSNLFGYDSDNYFNFEKISREIAGLFTGNSGGKSSFLDSICFSIYGSTPTTSTYDEIVNTYKDEYYSRVKINSTNGLFVITRSGKKTKKTISNKVVYERYVDGSLVDTDGDSASVKEKIKKYFGDEKSYSNTAYMFQRSNNNFLDLTPTKRLDYIYDASGISSFNILNKVAKDITSEQRNDFKYHSKQSYNNDLSDCVDKIKNYECLVEKYKDKLSDKDDIDNSLSEYKSKLKNVQDELDEISKKVSLKSYEDEDYVNVKIEDIQKKIDHIKKSHDINVQEIKEKYVKERSEIEEKINEHKLDIKEKSSLTYEDSSKYKKLLKDKEEQKSKLNDLDYDKTEYEEEINSVQEECKKLQESIDLTKKEHSKLKDQHWNKKNQLNNIKSDISKFKKDVAILNEDDRFENEDLCKSCMLLENAFKSKEKLETSVTTEKQLQEELEVLDDQIDSLNKKKEEMSSEYNVLSEKIDDLKEKKSQKDLKKVQVEYVKDKIASINKDIEEFPSYFEEKSKKYIDNIKDKIEILDEKLKNKEFNEKNDIEKLKNNSERMTAELTEKKEMLDSIFSKIETYNSLKSKVESYRKLHEDMKETQDQLNSVYGSLEYHNRIKEDTIKNIDLYKSLKQEMNVVNKFIESTERNNMPIAILRDIIDSINYEVNSIIEKLTDFNIILSISDSNLEAHISNEKGIRKANRLAGMESVVTNLALRLGISNIGNIPMPTFLIADEALGAFDSNVRQNLTQLFDFFREHLKFVIVVDHNAVMKDFVDKEITIGTKGDFAYINSSEMF